MKSNGSERNLRHGQWEREDDDLLLLLLWLECQQQRKEFLQFLQHDLLLDLAIRWYDMFRDQDQVQQDDRQEEQGRLLALVQSHLFVWLRECSQSMLLPLLMFCLLLCMWLL